MLTFMLRPYCNLFSRLGDSSARCNILPSNDGSESIYSATLAVNIPPGAHQQQQHEGHLSMRNCRLRDSRSISPCTIPLPLHPVPEAVCICVRHISRLFSRQDLPPVPRPPGQATAVDSSSEGREEDGLLLLRDLWGSCHAPDQKCE